MHVRAQGHASVYVLACVRLGLHMFFNVHEHVRACACVREPVRDGCVVTYLRMHVMLACEMYATSVFMYESMRK